VVEDVRLHGPGHPEPVRSPELSIAAVACASPTAARNILAWNPWLRSRPFVAIGPTTGEALRRELGVELVIEAKGTTDADMLNAIRAAARPTEDT